MTDEQVTEEEPVEPARLDDVLNPTELLEIYHPDTRKNQPNGEPITASVSRSAFEEVYRDKGWVVAEDPYAYQRVAPEPEAEGPGVAGSPLPDPVPEAEVQSSKTASKSKE